MRLPLDQQSSGMPGAQLRLHRETISGLEGGYRAILLALVIVAWFAANLVARSSRLLVFSPDLHLAVEASSSFARLFGALVLFLAPGDAVKPRLRWLAASFLLLGLGGLAFGFLPPLLGDPISVNGAMYLSSYLWTAAGVLMLAGIVPRRPPALEPAALLAIVAGILILPAVLAALPVSLPELVHPTSLTAEVGRDQALLSGMTTWHWMISAIPLLLAIAAVAAAIARRLGNVLGGWLLIALILFAGAQLHDLLWPSAFGPVMTTSDILELFFAAVVAVAGIVELQRFGNERAELLDREREYSRRLKQLSMQKSDFTAMVAHELGNPIAAIRRQTDLIDRANLQGDSLTQALTAIQSETKLLNQLVLDVQASAQVDRADFDIHIRPCSVEALIADAAAFGRTLPGRHHLTVQGTTGRVLADPERIGQVLRNLLGNAAKYASEDAPIALRAVRDGEAVRFEVEDRGFGIPEADIARIFGKFERGAAARNDRQHGLGLGLYLATRIIAAHGGTLTVVSAPGVGSTFSFRLEVVA